MNFAADILECFPASKPALVAIGMGGERRVWHFGELAARSAGLSGALAARGVRRGDTVMILVGNRPEWALAMLACWRIGAIALPCNAQLRRADLTLRIAAANPALAIVDEAQAEEFPGGTREMSLGELTTILDEERPQEPPAEPAELAPDDPALIVFTSGTTGEARGALHSRRYLAGQALQAEHWYSPRDGELAWCTAASGWSKSSRNSFLAAWLRGAAALLHDGRFDPAERLALIEREGVNVLCQAPTEYRLIAKRAELRPLSSLRRLVSAGEALNPEVNERFHEALGLEIHDGYGQTETGAVTGTGPDEPVRPGSMGRPLPGIEIGVAEADGVIGARGDPGELAEGERSGELLVRAASCPTFFDGYLDAPGGPDLVEGEWWRTGDHVRIDTDGYLWYEGREDDIIVSAGYRIGPFEVESALVGHPAVAEAAAVPAPDPDRGSIVKAIVVLRDGAPGDEPARLRLAEELKEHVKRTTAPYKHPRIVEFADALPKTASGKVKRAELRELG